MKIFSIIYFLFAFRLCGFAQVGIGTVTPSSSAILDVTSTSKGLLLPRMTKAQRNAIASPSIGLMVFCTDCGNGEFQVQNLGGWSNVVGGPPASLVIGESYGGGKVAYFLQNGDPGYIAGQMHGLIVAASDQSTGAAWGCPGAGIIGGDGTALGTGNQNTIDIVNGCSTAGIAARICYDLVLGGYSDWYLPSQDELNKLYLNRVAIGGFAASEYWSSSEYGDSNAWLQFFTNSNQNPYNKSLTHHVRAVRAF